MKKKSIIFIVVILVFLMVVGAAVGLVLHKRMSHNTEVSDLTVGDSPEGEEYAAEEASDTDARAGHGTGVNAKVSADSLSGISITKTGLMTGIAKENTVMIYMVGSDLESKMGAATLDVAEMLSSGVDTSKTNVVIFTGGTSQWFMEIPSDKNVVLRLKGSEGGILDGETSDMKNMGEADTLLGFLNFCYENYPSDHYSLIFWDHGAGPVYGYGVDEVYSNDIMNFNEMQAAMDASPFCGDDKLDLVGFDACLMASIEYAELFRDHADYMVASQEVEPGMGWDYEFLKTYNSTSEPKKIAESIMSEFGSFYDMYASQMQNPMYTLSCMDLSKTSKIEDAVNAFFGDLYEGLGNSEYGEIVKARDNALNLGAAAYGSKGDSIDQIDIGSMADEFDDMYSASSKGIQDALSDFVVSQNSNVDGTSGISIYFPYSNQLFYQYFGESVIEDISVCENYTTFVTAFAKAWESGGANVSDFYTALDNVQEEPVTEEPATEEPATEAPTEEPATEAPTEEPATEAPTEGPATEAPTEEPATEAPTEEPATEAPTEEPATEAPTEEPATEEPTEEPAEEQPSGTPLEASNSAMSITLTKDQLRDLKSATYSILYKNTDSEYDDAYIPIFTNVKIKPDNKGVLSVPFDPEILVVETGDGAVIPWPFRQIDVQSKGTMIFQSTGLYLINSVVDMPDTTMQAVTCNVAVRSGEEPQILSFDMANDGSYSGKSTVDVEGWSNLAYYAPTYLPIRDSNGRMLPYSEWDRDGVFYMAYTTLGAGFSFKYKKLSEISEQFVCQLVLTDVNGNKYATDLTDYTRMSRSVTTVDGIEYAVYDDHAVTLSFDGSTEDVVIPDNVDGKPVTSIGNETFKLSKIKSVVLPEGLKGISFCAFQNCSSLESVTLPSTLETIDEQAFLGCGSLKDITIPEGLKFLGSFAFSNCKKIDAMTLPTSLVYYGEYAVPYEVSITFEGNENYKYENEALFTADGKTLVQCFSKEESYIIPKGTEVIGCQAFRYNYHIKNITIPEGVKTISSGAFFTATGLDGDKLTFPDTLEVIGDQAFGCTVFDERNPIKTLKLGRNVRKIGKNAFNMFEISSFEVDEKNETFSSKEGFLTNKNGDAVLLAPYVDGDELVIPNGIATLYTDDMFSQNKDHVDKLVLSDTVVTLNASSLYGIEELKIGSGLRNILSINSLATITSIEISEGNLNFTVVDDVLYSKDMKELLLYMKNKKDTSFDIPEGVTRIERNAFNYNDNLKEISIPKSLRDIGTEIGSSAGNVFSEAPSLKKITVSVTNKHYAARNGILYSKDGTIVYAIPRKMSGTVELEKSATTIEAGAAYSLENVDEVKLPEGLVTIKSSNFMDIKAKIHIPETATNISSRTFDNTKGITICGKKGSVAEELANARGLKFEEE